MVKQDIIIVGLHAFEWEGDYRPETVEDGGSGLAMMHFSRLSSKVGFFIFEKTLEK